MSRTSSAMPLSRKRPVNLTLSEGLIAELKGYTSNLSATAEELLTAYVVEQKQARSSRQQQADQTGHHTLFRLAPFQRNLFVDLGPQLFAQFLHRGCVQFCRLKEAAFCRSKSGKSFKIADCAKAAP